MSIVVEKKQDNIVERTLAEGMSQQLERLRSRRADLEEAIGFCTLLQQENGPWNNWMWSRRWRA